jgi:hypothetical protein
MRVAVVSGAVLLGVREAFFIVKSPRMTAVDLLESRILNGRPEEAQA